MLDERERCAVEDSTSSRCPHMNWRVAITMFGPLGHLSTAGRTEPPRWPRMSATNPRTRTPLPPRWSYLSANIRILATLNSARSMGTHSGHLGYEDGCTPVGFRRGNRCRKRWTTAGSARLSEQRERGMHDLSADIRRVWSSEALCCLGDP